MSAINSTKSECIDVRASLTAAAHTCADHHQLTLNEAQWQAFATALDRPVQRKPRLQRLLSEPSVLG